MMISLVERVRRVLQIQRRAAANAIAKRVPERRRETRFDEYVLSYPSRSIVGRAVAEGLVWDPQLAEIVERLPERALVCEVGSNIGASLLTMARQRGDIRFVCFEPSPRFLPFLRSNVARNGLDSRVTIEPRLVGPAGDAWVLHSNTSTASVSEGAYAGHVPLQSTTFRSIALDHYFEGSLPPSFIKVDTDGFELKVLRSAQQLLVSYHPLLFVEYSPFLLARLGDHGDALLDFLIEVGYSFTDIYAADGTLIERNRSLSARISTTSYVDILVHG
jgi:FkbM family methyltransferase